ncbi:MAG: SPOR domain-containing protein [Cytophagaceae bacterium]|nr:SPOR domain-containing protein [Cytophagaceae bacterium]
MKRSPGICSLIFALTLLACAPKTAPVGNRTDAGVGEDLSVFRPRYDPATVSKPAPKKEPLPEAKRPVTAAVANDQPLHINRRLDMVLDTLATRNRYVKHAQGYRIQLYVGTSRQEADAMKIYVYQNFPELNVYLTYSAPTYRMRVGDFMNRMDVERYYNSIKNQNPGAMILSDKVEIRKSLMIK